MNTEPLEKLREVLADAALDGPDFDLHYGDVGRALNALVPGMPTTEYAALLGYRSRDGIVSELNSALRASMDRENAKQLEIDGLTQKIEEWKKSSDWAYEEINRLSKERSDFSTLNAELVAALEGMDALMENLWGAVNWGSTFRLNAILLNEAPLNAKRALAKAKGNQ